jgi:hypothetical protein
MCLKTTRRFSEKILMKHDSSEEHKQGEIHALMNTMCSCSDFHFQFMTSHRGGIHVSTSEY